MLLKSRCLRKERLSGDFSVCLFFPFICYASGIRDTDGKATSALVATLFMLPEFGDKCPNDLKIPMNNTTIFAFSNAFRYLLIPFSEYLSKLIFECARTDSHDRLTRPGELLLCPTVPYNVN